MSKRSIYIFRHNIRHTFRQSIGQTALFLFSLIFGLVTSTAAQDSKRAADSKDVADRALEWFKRIKDQSFSDSLGRIRRAPVQSSFKAEVLEKVSAGEPVVLTAKMKAKLAALT